MSSQRTCRRCGGEEFIMTTPAGVIIAWRSKEGKEGTWFCPCCDWGESCAQQPG